MLHGRARRAATGLLVLAAAGIATAAAGDEPGILVRVYNVGESMHRLPTLAPHQTPNFVKISASIDLDSSRGDFGELADNFITELTGFLSVEQSARYAFRLISDDGAKLWIDDALVIDHDGLHGPDPKDGSVHLDAGRHKLRILHFEAGGGERLTLRWKPPGTSAGAEYATIPAAALSHAAGASLATSPGKKRVIQPLRRGRPGDGTPVEGVHPMFEGRTEHKIHNVLLVSHLRMLDSRIKVLTRDAIPFEPTPPGASFIWLPQAEATFVKMSVIRVPAGVFLDQALLAESHGFVRRMFLESVGDRWMGCILRFMRIDARKLYAVELDRKGKLHALQAIEGESRGSVTRAIEHRFLPTGATAFEILAVRAMTNGFEIEFTKPLDSRVGWEAESFYVEKWPFDLEKQQSPTRDGVRYPVKSASVSADRMRVFLEIEDLKTSHVVYLRLLTPCVSEDGELPWSTEAWYTLNAIPRDRYGKVLTPQPPQPQNFLTDAERAAGWRLLFDGKTTSGWRGFKKDRVSDGWQVIDGCLVRVGPGGDVVTDEQFDNFELELEWRISAAGNSGIFFRVSEKYRFPWDTGPEMQVLDNAEHPDGRSPLTSAGSNYALHAAPRDATVPVGLFNQVRIVANGDHVEYWLNGKKVVEYEFNSPEWKTLIANSKFKSMPNYGRMKTGHIVLQDHGDKVWYRNIKIRPLAGN